MKTVYFVRHGETLFNKEKRLQGWNDSPLSDNGIAHARSVAMVIAGFNIQKALVSPLGRAKQTANIIRDLCGIELEVDENLKEVSFGDFEGNTLPQLDEKYPGMWEARMADKWNYCPPNGEANKDALPRALSVIEKIEKLADNESLLIIAHFAINRILFSLLSGIEPDETVCINVPHGHIYRTHQSNGVWLVSHLDSADVEKGFQPGWVRQNDPTKPMGG
jgi:broad specificity phosphatase PhoE